MLLNWTFEHRALRLVCELLFHRIITASFALPSCRHTHHSTTPHLSVLCLCMRQWCKAHIWIVIAKGKNNLSSAWSISNGELNLALVQRRAYNGVPFMWMVFNLSEMMEYDDVVDIPHKRPDQTRHAGFMVELGAACSSTPLCAMFWSHMLRVSLIFFHTHTSIPYCLFYALNWYHIVFFWACIRFVSRYLHLYKTMIGYISRWLMNTCFASSQY